MRSPSNIPGRAVLRRLGAGRLYYRIVHGSFPSLRWKPQFGWRNAWAYARGEKAMQRAAPQLPPITANDPGGLACTFMTGRTFWHQTLFCAHSLAQSSGGSANIRIFDDGTLTAGQEEALRRALQGVTLVSPAEIGAKLDDALPRHAFPLLRSARDAAPLMRKLVDLRAGHEGWQLYLDSDMIFLQRPDFLHDRAARTKACYMLDRVYAYTLPIEQLSAIAGHTVPPYVNAGIVGLTDDVIDWNLLERWLEKIPPQQHSARLIEQTLTAMIVGTQDPAPAPNEHYHILYDSFSPAPEGAALLHFIFHAKLRYFTRDWRDYLTRISAAGNE